MRRIKSVSRRIRKAAVVGGAVSVVLGAGSVAQATVYQWNGTTDSVWATASNWDSFGAAPTGTLTTSYTAAHRLNVLNGALSPLVYTDAQGTTNYGSGALSIRGLAIAQTSNGYMTITGGTFSSLNAGGSQDLLTYDKATTGVLNISGGNFIGASGGTLIGADGTAISGTINVTSGSATLSTLTGNATLSTVNLNGGTLSANSFTKRTNSTSVFNFNFNGGTLTARQSTANFFGTGTTAVSSLNVKSGGAIIDTAGSISISIAQGLLAGTPSGGLTKTGTGTLTLGSANTYTGETAVKNGTLLLSSTGTIAASSGLVLGDSGGTLGTLDVANKASFSQSNVSGKGLLNIGSGKTITLTGTLAPGFSLGQVDVTGNLALGSNTNMEVAATDAADLVNVSESITYGGALAITGYSGFNIAGQAGSYNLFDFAGADNGKFGTVSVGGASLNFASNQWTGSSGSAQYTFNEGTGVLSVVVPEPTSAAGLLAAGALMAIRRRRRA